MPDLILLRHGQSQWNLENRFTGWVDVPLSERGDTEARAAGEKLRGRTIHRLFTSVLQRATETARIALESDALIFRWSSFRWPLEHLLKDTFYVSNEAVGDAPFEFERNAAGAIDSFRFMDRTFRRQKP